MRQSEEFEQRESMQQSAPGAPAPSAAAAPSAEAVLARLSRNMDAKSRALLKIHMRRALIHAEKCEACGLAVLDCCGEAGDLFFLLEHILTAAQRGNAPLTELLQNMLSLMTQSTDTQPLSLSRHELGMMAETQLVD